MAEERFEALTDKARQALGQGSAALARQLYEQALAEQSESADAHFGLATACFLLNDLQGAAFHFKEVTRLDHHRAGAFINLGAIYNRLNQLDDALAALRRGIQLDSKRVEGYYNLGLVYRRRGQMDLALDAYREATRLNPRMAEAQYNLANLLFELGRYAQAVAHYKKAIEANAQFENARVGLREAEKKVRESHEAAITPVQTVSPIPPIKGISDEELHRTLDPLDDGPFLSALHKVTVESEKISREFLRVLEHELEPSIKELSSTLLYPEKIAAELTTRLKHLDIAMEHVSKMQRAVQTSMKKLRKIGEHSPAGTPLEGSHRE